MGFLMEDPSVSTPAQQSLEFGDRPLPIRVFKRDKQGTFVYAPDIQVYVATEGYGVVDLSPYITNFTLQRNVNATSTFVASVSNKYARFDRVVRRMDRIIVFLKRVAWLQEFSGYVTVAPWETVVPGDSQIMAECTLKRLEASYWDPHSSEAQQIFPFASGAEALASEDGGAAVSMFKLLRTVTDWNANQIQIQKLPDKWLEKAMEILRAAREEELAEENYQQVRDSLRQLFEADGWLSQFPSLGTLLDNDSGGGAREPALNALFYYPGPSALSSALVGKRAWVNDVPVMESVTQLASASMRDFQSAPNGDFVAFFPDRLGKYGKFPALEVRDIEIADFKLVVSDKPMVTHYVSVGDLLPTHPDAQADFDVFILAGYVTVEQDPVMRLLLGMPEGSPTGLGRRFIQRFGIRPRRDDNHQIRNPGWNYTIALHRFQEAWANQWQAIVEFTFLPELYPGMRVELVDHGLAVYVEGVIHQGSRTGGFTTIATVSTPMRRGEGAGDEWVLLQSEYGRGQFPEEAGETHPINQLSAADLIQRLPK